MPYPVGHRAEVKGKIIQSARRLFNRHGFDNVSIQQIMAGAGLTHGGFYSYFRSKSDLCTTVLGCFLTDPEWMNHGEGVAGGGGVHPSDRPISPLAGPDAAFFAHPHTYPFDRFGIRPGSQNASKLLI